MIDRVIAKIHALCYRIETYADSKGRPVDGPTVVIFGGIILIFGLVHLCAFIVRAMR